MSELGLTGRFVDVGIEYHPRLFMSWKTSPGILFQNSQYEDHAILAGQPLLAELFNGNPASFK